MLHTKPCKKEGKNIYFEIYITNWEGVKIMSVKGFVKSQGNKFLAFTAEHFPESYTLAGGMVASKMSNDDAEVSIKSFAMLGFAAVIIGAFIPMGLNALNSADTSNFTSTEIAIYGIIGVAMLIAVVMALMNVIS